MYCVDKERKLSYDYFSARRLLNIVKGKKEGHSPRSPSVALVFPLASFPGLHKFRTASNEHARPGNEGMFPLLSGWTTHKYCSEIKVVILAWH